jgi:predicted branched-subunit amino acid permease
LNFGARAVENGLAVLEAMLISGALLGGASEMVGIEVIDEGTWLDRVGASAR